MAKRKTPIGQDTIDKLPKGRVRKELTIKERKLVKAVVEGKSKTQAALEAYDVKDPNIARGMAYEALQRPIVQAAVQAELERQGINLETVLRPIKEGLEAKQESRHKFGEEVNDIPTRLKASQMAQKLMGIDKPEKNGGDTYNIVYQDF